MTKTERPYAMMTKAEREDFTKALIEEVKNHPAIWQVNPILFLLPLTSGQAHCFLAPFRPDPDYEAAPWGGMCAFIC